MPNNNGDYFMKMAKRAEPFQKAVGRTKPATAPKAAKAPEPPQFVRSHTVYQDDDYQYMTKAVKRLSDKMQPKSTMGKSSPRR